MQTKTVEDFSDFESEQNQQAHRLQTWERRLWILLGAVSMLVLVGLIEPELWEVGPILFIWLLAILLPLLIGVYILVWPSWHSLSLKKRLNCGFGGIAISLLAFSFLPLFAVMGGIVDGVPLLILVSLIGVILFSFYKRVQRSFTKQADDDFFI